jgi:hypothetical protein
MSSGFLSWVYTRVMSVMQGGLAAAAAGVLVTGGATARAQTIPPGFDLFETPAGSTRVVIGGTSQIPPIPADFFFPGSQPWEGTIELRGDPLPGYCGAVNTVLERKEEAVMPGPATIEVELKELSLASVDPITVSDGGRAYSFFDVFVEIDPERASTGSMTIEETMPGGGTYSMDTASGGGIYVYASFNFFEAWPSARSTAPPGRAAIPPLTWVPPDPLLLESAAPAQWQREEPADTCIYGNDFYPVPGLNLQTVLDGGGSGEHECTPGGPVDGCCLPCGTCIEVNPIDCHILGGVVQGEPCAYVLIACCMPDGSCIEVDPVCCDDMGGVPSPTGQPACLGDVNGNGTDDACEPDTVVIPVGECELETTAGSTRVHIGGMSLVPEFPADFFYPGSLPWSGTIELRGHPLPDHVGAVNTLIRRKEAAVMPGPATVEVELKELSLASVEPITVIDAGRAESFFDVFVTIDENRPSEGAMTIQEMVPGPAGGGMYSMDSASGGGIYIYATFHFFEAWPSRGTPPIVWDAPDPLLLETAGSCPWQYEELESDGKLTPMEECRGGNDGGNSGEHGWIGPREVEACCMPDDTCIVSDPDDCIAIGGQLSPTREPTCGPGGCDQLGSSEIITPGFMYLETTSGSTHMQFGGSSTIPPIPADFFFPGSQSYEGIVQLDSSSKHEWVETKPYAWPDVIVERYAAPILASGSATVEVELKELNLASSEPITILDDSFPPNEYEYNVQVTLNDNAGMESMGSMLIVPTDDYGGVYHMDAAHGGGIYVYARFNFFEAWPSRGVQMVWDPPAPLLLETVGPEGWQYADREDTIECLSFEDSAEWEWGHFYPIAGDEIQVVLDGGQTGEHGCIPPRPREGCCMPEGYCIDTDPTDCAILGGTPQGEPCTQTSIACCLHPLEDPDCLTIDPLCCDDMGGAHSPTGQPGCLHDNNGNGQDDACEVPTVIPIGTDYWKTTVGSTQVVIGGTSQIPPIPADYFFPGSQPYEGIVLLGSSPWQTGEIYQVDTDSVVERKEQADISGGPDTIQVELVALDLTSMAPIIVMDSGDPPTEHYYDVEVTLNDNPGKESLGHMTISPGDSYGGTFEFDSASGGGIYVYARFNFFEAWPSRGLPIVWDPPDSLLLESVGPHPYQYEDPGLIDNPGNDFYGPPDEELETELDDGLSGFHVVIPARPIAACCYDDGTCEDTNPTDCQDNGGTPVPGVTCDEIDCLVKLQACCYTNGTCQDQVASVCEANGGTPLGYGTSCAGDSDGDGFDELCEVACCISGGVICVTTSVDWCLIGWEGISMGYCTQCLGDGDNNGLDDACEATVISPGRDYWATISPTEVTFGMGGLLPPIPADFFYPGSLPWEGTIDLMGEPLDVPNLGNASSAIKRNCTGLLAQPALSDTVEIELVALQLKGTAPIPVLDIASPEPTYYDVAVTLDPGHPSVGDMTVTSAGPSEDSGVYSDVRIELYPLFEFTPVGSGSVIEDNFLGPDVLYYLLWGIGPYPWEAIPPIDPPLSDSGPDFYPTAEMALELMVPGPVVEPVGIHTNQPPGLGCCLPDGMCIDICLDECLNLLGIPQDTPCAGTTMACCLDPGFDPDCADVDPVCCDEQGGTLPPTYEPVCLGDINGNGRDDACEPATVIPIGHDYFETPAGSSWVRIGGASRIPPIPADFFFPGSQPYEGVIELRGDPLPEACGAVNTVVERKEEADLTSGSAMIEVELKELSLVSVAPITVTDAGRAEYEYDVGITINPGIPSEGQMLIVETEADGGIYEMKAVQSGGIYIYARFNFFEAWPSRAAPPIVWDPPDPLRMTEQVTLNSYQYEEPPIACELGSEFYPVPGEVLPMVLDDGDTGEHGCIPPREVDGCCLPDGTCVDIAPEDCLILGGNPQGQLCTGTIIACCLQDGRCVNVDLLCCDDMQGTPSLFANACMGDINGSGIDDACEPPQACCMPEGVCLETSHTDCVNRGGDPQGPGTDCASGITVCQQLKWAQPPTFNPDSPQPGCFWGWDEYSEYFGSQIVADDWACDTEQPVTDIHWWGSYIGYSGMGPPMLGPVSFHIGLWTDVPATSEPDCCQCWNIFPPLSACEEADFDELYCLTVLGAGWEMCEYHAGATCQPDDTCRQTFSHPGTMIHEWTVDMAELTERPVACDFHPDFMNVPDGCFRYDYSIPPGEWFHQGPVCAIYWISIAPIYLSVPDHPWGWKTREHHYNDDAVRIFWPTDPWVDDEYLEGEPIEDLAGATWDMAFVLTTQEPTGACCLSDGRCVETTATDCAAQPGTYQGDSTECTAVRACCFDNGTCRMLDPLCCVDQGGTPMCPECVCAGDLDACCLGSGECVMADPTCCEFLGGVPQGPFSECTELQGCCLDDGLCLDLDPLCCVELGGIPQGPATACVDMTIACCLDPVNDPDCIRTDPLCCDDEGGTPSEWPHVCLGDNNGSGVDDACEPLNPPVLPLDEKHQARKNRYLSIDPSTNPERDTVIKVEVAEMRRCVVDPRRACLVDEDCDPVCANDLDKYCTSSDQCGGADCIETGPCVDMAPNYDPPLTWLVQQPQQVYIGCRGPVPPGMHCGDPASGPDAVNCCTDEDWIARLSHQAYVEPGRWQDYDLNGVDNRLLHISDCPTVPCVTYHVYACDPQNLDVCSEPLEIATQRFPALFPFKLYADVAGGTVLPGPEVLPPDGYVNVKDLMVTLLTMLNYGTATKPQAHPTWVDMYGLGTGIPPNYIMCVGDLSAVYVFSLTRGLPYVNTQGGLDPGSCPAVPRIGGYSNSGCLPESRPNRSGGDPWCDEDAFEFTVEPGTLHALHRNATYWCAQQDIEVSMSLQGNVLRLTEREIEPEPTDCLCCYDVESTVVDLPPGPYTVEYCWLDYESGWEELCHTTEVVIPEPEPQVGSYSDSGCLTAPNDRGIACGEDQEDQVEFTPGPSSLYVLHRNAVYNCCPDDIVITLTVEGSVLRLREEEVLTMPCWCLCCYDVEATLIDLAPGAYTAELCWYDYDTGGEECYLEDIEIP